MPIWEKSVFLYDLGIFQMTATAAAATSQELSDLARPLAHHAQGANIPFRESLTSMFTELYPNTEPDATIQIFVEV